MLEAFHVFYLTLVLIGQQTHRHISPLSDLQKKSWPFETCQVILTPFNHFDLSNTNDWPP
jgi:hypothetical protein